MSAVKIVCLGCRKRFSGEPDKLRSINSCPRCKKSGAWWSESGPADTTPMSGTGQSADQDRPVSAPPLHNHRATPLRSTTPLASGPRLASAPLEAAHGSGSALLVVGAVGVVIAISLVAVGAYWLGTRTGSKNTSAEEGGNSSAVQSPQPETDGQAAPTRQEMCKLRGRITWKYNAFVGTKGDTGAYVFLLPVDFSDDPVSPPLVASSEQKSGLHWTTCGGDGQYIFDRISPGKYTILVCSKNTMGPLNQLESFDRRVEAFLKWFKCKEETDRLALRLLIGQHKYMTDELDFLDGEEREFHHDFGITWW